MSASHPPSRPTQPGEPHPGAYAGPAPASPVGNHPLDDNHHLHWGAETLWQQLEPLLPGLAVEVVARMPSTNTTLVERARRSAGGTRADDRRAADAAQAAGTPHDGGRRQSDHQPGLLVAELQTQGRGRQGKTWHAEAGASLTFSLALPLAPADWSGLSLAVGLALADALDPPDPLPGCSAPWPRIRLKWPNDLLWQPEGAATGRKLGGILIETVPVGTTRVAVIGIGLNVRPQGRPQGDLSWGHANLQEAWPGLSAPQALARVALPLVRALQAFERHGFAPLAEAYARRDALLGRPVHSTQATTAGGVADGVDRQGMLWLKTASGRVAVGSGEVSLALAASGQDDAPSPDGPPPTQPDTER